MYRFFKCNILGGFRLSDLSRKVYQGEFFYVDAFVCDTSKSVRAALTHKWMTEVSGDEASQHIMIPTLNSLNASESVELISKRFEKNVAIPDAKEVNKKIESRQIEKTFRKQPKQKQKEEERPIVPNFNSAERKMRERQADVTTKGPDEVLKSPVEHKRNVISDVKIKLEESVVKDLANDISADNSLLSTPNFDEIKKEAKEKISDDIQKIVRRRKIQ